MIGGGARIQPALVALLLILAAPAAAVEPEDDPPITFVLEDAPARDVLDVLASLRKLELKLDPDVAGPVTVELKAVPLSMALDEVCRQVDCEWEIEEGPPSVLRVSSTGPPVQRVTLDIVDRPLREAVVELEAEAGLTLSLSESLDPELPVTLQVEDQPLSVVLEKLAPQIDARWSLRSGVYVVSPDVRGLPDADLVASVPRPFDVGLRVTRLGEETASPGGVSLSWSRPVLVRPLDADGRLQLVLTWLPLGPEDVRLLPLVIACDGEAATLVERFALVDPGGGETHLLQIGELTVEVDTDPPRSWPVERPPVAPPVCGSTEAPMLSVRLGEREKRWATMRYLLELPGRFWLVTSRRQAEAAIPHQNIGAVVYLGRAPGDQSVRELLVASRDVETGLVSVSPFEVSADKPATVSLTPLGGEGPSYAVRVKATD